MKRLLLSATVLFFTAQSAIAADTELVAKWYSALKTSNRETFKELLADEATLDLKPLEITQTKAEYIEALDNWEDVAKDLTLIMKGVNSTGETTASANVCYKFSENSFLNEELFIFLDGKVTSYTQNRLKDEC